MRFAIDVVFADRGWRVVRVRRDVKPFRAVLGGRRARHVIEVQAGWADLSGLKEGEALALLAT
jgi:uncharacterized membrane protein (UPF0127 family)